MNNEQLTEMQIFWAAMAGIIIAGSFVLWANLIYEC